MSGFTHRLRQNATDAERRLWATLRDRRLRGHKFRRQHPIGRFVVDFACTKHRLVVEADGGQHCGSRTDAERTSWLEAQGWQVIRFGNHDILANMDGVVTTILRALDERGPSPGSLRSPPSPAMQERGLQAASDRCRD
jgi:very-short-patch-repair endonuclease